MCLLIFRCDRAEFISNLFTVTFRFCIWSKGAIEKLDALYGTGKKPSSEKKDFK